MALSRSQQRVRSQSDPAALDVAAATKIPWVVAFLTETQWEDGDERQPGTILVVAEEGYWKAWVNDRACLRSAWVSGSDLLGLLDRIERGLSGGDLPWRSDKGSRRK